jgi:hypothetical protein
MRTNPPRGPAILAGLCLAGPVLAAALLPKHYLRQATWQETMLASLETITRAGLKDGFAPFESETLRGGEPAQIVTVPLAGAQELYLFVTGCPDVKWGVADWADARLVRKDGTVEFLT